MLEGKALRVEPEALVMEVRKTSNASMYPKVASYSVPRSALKTLQLRQKTYHWRIIGTAVGAVGGLIIGVKIRDLLFPRWGVRSLHADIAAA
jgi:hypothetical protein